MREPRSPSGRGVATRLILGPMLLLILLLAAAPALAASPEIEFVDGAPMPPNVRPAIICSGSDYEMGYQYFNQLITIHGWEWWLPSSAVYPLPCANCALPWTGLN